MAVLTLLTIVVVALPASLLARFVPAGVAAADFSGTIWHGSAGRVTVGGRDAGALEWHLHPATLLRLRLGADFHWVKGGFELEGIIDAGRGDFTASGIQGGGPIADLAILGVPGWRGTANVRLQKLSADFSPQGAVLRAAVGEIDVADASLPQVGGGADLGSYALTFNDPVLAADDQATADLADTGGPLSVRAAITLSPKTRTGLLSGSLQERGEIPDALRRELDQVAQMHARDSQGRIPVDLEFSY